MTMMRGGGTFCVVAVVLAIVIGASHLSMSDAVSLSSTTQRAEVTRSSGDHGGGVVTLRSVGGGKVQSKTAISHNGGSSGGGGTAGSKKTSPWKPISGLPNNEHFQKWRAAMDPVNKDILQLGGIMKRMKTENPGKRDGIIRAAIRELEKGRKK